VVCLLAYRYVVRNIEARFDSNIPSKNTACISVVFAYSTTYSKFHCMGGSYSIGDATTWTPTNREAILLRVPVYRNSAGTLLLVLVLTLSNSVPHLAGQLCHMCWDLILEQHSNNSWEVPMVEKMKAFFFIQKWLLTWNAFCQLWTAFKSRGQLCLKSVWSSNTTRHVPKTRNFGAKCGCWTLALALAANQNHQTC